MNGRTGQTLSGQYFQKLEFRGDCPVPLGTSASYFKFRANEITINVNSDNAELSGASAYSYIDVMDSSGITQANARISAISRKQHTYYIKGVVSHITALINSNVASYSIFELENLEFTRNSPNNITLRTLAPSATSFDKVYLYPTTIGFNGVYAEGSNIEVNIKKGFSVTTDDNKNIYLSKAYNSGGPILNFLESSYTGGSGPSEVSRSYIGKLSMVGDKSHPTVNVNHGVDIVELVVYGGNINFMQPPTSDSTIVQKGFLYSNTGKIVATEPSVTIGANGDFTVVDPTNVEYIPDITLKGSWNIDLIPGGVTGG